MSSLNITDYIPCILVRATHGLNLYLLLLKSVILKKNLYVIVVRAVSLKLNDNFSIFINF
ncbi:hypothetical protein QTP88_020006 [Uroleucon formosanum]